jgi:AraC-like DNA-binding protein
MILSKPRRVLGKIAVDFLAEGDGWSVEDVTCTAGPGDRPFEERHSEAAIALVVGGSFAYRSRWGRGLMTPGSWLLGNPGDHFECSHDHAVGDRCVAFHYSPDYFERLAADAGAPRAARRFEVSRVPPVRGLSPLVARAAAAIAGSGDIAWEELALEVAGAAVRAAGALPTESTEPQAAMMARVTESVRTIEQKPEARWTLAQLAASAGQSPFHYLRTFERVTGVTPHQFILRARLREAAARLQDGESKIIDIALATGFGDLSNFNRAFRIEFGVVPRAYRRHRKHQ